MRKNPAAYCVLLKLKCTLLSVCLVIASINPSALLAQGSDVDIVVPKITQIEKRVDESGQSQTIIATVIDDRAVQNVTLYYRFGQAEEYTAKSMKPTADDRYEATISMGDKKATLLQYYIETADTSGNSTFRGYAFSPMTMQLTPEVVMQSDSQSDSIVAPASTDAPLALPEVEPKPAQKPSTGNRTLYTVLGVVAAAVLVGVVNAAGKGGGGSDNGTVTFTSTEP